MVRREQVTIEDCRDSVYRFALSLSRDRNDAEDLAQEAMLKATQNQVQFLEAQQPLHWLFTVTRRLWIDELRRRERRGSPVGIETGAVVSESNDPSRQLQLHEDVQRAFHCMMQLPIKQREVLYLRTIEGLTIDEIAATIDGCRNRVKANLSAARKTMRERMGATASSKTE